MTGRKIGNYEVLEELGRGGMGTVYKARDRRLRRLVALKFLSESSTDENAKARFLREGQAASALQHPNIVTIYDIGEEDGAAYIVMEYVEGAPLREMITHHGLAAAKALDLLVQLADALAAAHQAGIVHRDLKPSNVIVDQAGRVKILDFGLAKFTAPADSEETQAMPLTRAGSFVGTTQYISPEQASGGEVDARSDIFSFAVVAQEMLTGSRPFHGASQWALLHEIAHGKPRRIRDTHPHLPAALDDLIFKMLAKQPRERAGDMREVLARLREIRLTIENPEPTQILPRGETAAERSSESSSSGAEKDAIAVLMFRSLSPDKDDQYLAEGIATEVVRALAGIPGVSVVSQRASFRVTEESGDLASVARDLHARYVLTGNVRRAGNKVRVIAELDDAVAGIQLWSQKYDRSTDDTLTVQEEIAQAVAGAVGGQLIRTRTGQAAQAAPETLDAAGLVRKAYHFTNQAYHKEALNDAVNLLRQALEIDPNYAFARAFMAFFLIQRVVTNASEDVEKDRAEALASAEQAILAAPGDPEVLENAGLVLTHCGKFEKAVSTLRRAVEIAPSNFIAWGYLAFALGWAGNAEQMREAHAILERLVAQAPNHPSLPYWLCFNAGIFTREGKHSEAAEAAGRSVTLQPRFAPGLAAYANALSYLGRFEQAFELAGQMVAANPNGTQEAYMKELLVTTGSRERAEPHIGGLLAAGIFRGDVPWPTLEKHDNLLKRPTSASSPTG